MKTENINLLERVLKSKHVRFAKKESSSNVQEHIFVKLIYWLFLIECFNVCEFVIFIKKVYMWFLWKRKWRSMGDIFYNDNCWIIYAGSTWQNYHIIQGNNEIISFTMKWVQRSKVYNIFNSTFRLPKELFNGGNEEDFICELLWADLMCALM